LDLLDVGWVTVAAEALFKEGGYGPGDGLGPGMPFAVTHGSGGGVDGPLDTLAVKSDD